MRNLNWGVLGTARIAEQQVIPAITRSASGRVLAVSSSSGRAPEYAARTGIDRAYSSHEELLADPEVDAVYIPLPNSLHHPWILRAAQAGKHVLCEKPIALSAADLAEIEEAANTAGVHVAEAFMYRHHPQIERVRELLNSGEIGSIISIDARFHFRLDAAPGENIRLDGSLGGGALLDVGCYPIDLMNLLLDTEPTTVAAVAIREPGIGVETGVAGSFSFGQPPAVTGTFTAGFRSVSGDHCTIMGEKGTVTLKSPFRPDRNDGVGVLKVRTEDGSRTIEVPGDSYRGQIEALSERIRSDHVDEQDTGLTRRTTRTLERVADAMRDDDPSRPES